MDFERFSITKTLPELLMGQKNDVGIIYNISDQEKNTTSFNSKIRLRSEHVLSR